MKGGRIVTAVLIAAATVFAFAAGEYGTLDWFELRREERDERIRITELQHQVDSLQKMAAFVRAVKPQPATVAADSTSCCAPGCCA